jgi:hypothetical protein
MTTKHPRLVLALVLSVLGCGLLAAADPAAESESKDISVDLATGRDLAALFLTGDAETLHGRFSSQFKEEMSLEDLRAFQQRTRAKLGAEAAVLDEVLRPKDEYTYYVRRARFAKGEAEVHVMWRDGQLAAVFVRTPQKSKTPAS